MNTQEYDILNMLLTEGYENQRQLAKKSGHSLGMVNRSIKNLISEGYLTEGIALTDLAKQEARERAPKNAVILAAGFGLRMIPINTETPKGLLEVRGEPLIERLIRQLHEVNIKDITVVVGFMKEQYEYLMDEYGVKLTVCRDYLSKNNLHSLVSAEKVLKNTYIIPCDIWCRENPFRQHEFYSWYMVSNKLDEESPVRINRKQELVPVGEDSAGNSMVGIAYLTREDAKTLRIRLKELAADPKFDTEFWEETLREKDKMMLPARLVDQNDVVEINTYEQLRELDSHSEQLQTEAIRVIAEALGVDTSDIMNITMLKKGMTNRSFRFACKGKEYIMRIPGEGTDQLINRRQEAAVYDVVNPQGLCDSVFYINPDNGYKVTEYLSPARVCDPEDPEDIKKCMKVLRTFHEKGLKVDHDFDLFGQMEYYETLWNGERSVYRDYEKTKQNVLSLKEYINSQQPQKCLTHIDAVPDNFLFVLGEQGDEDIRLIDWEYAGMQDPHVDIAMFCIYSMYDREQVDDLIDAYFPEGCPRTIRLKIYCYIAACGLLWSNWCEYKRLLGVEFGEYSLRQYRYAKEYYRIVKDELNKSHHTVKRAIIMAAGEGKRMRPVTLHTPKPMVKVNGMRMIDTVIRGLHNQGITEIYVVVGYLKDAFATLPEEYPGLTLIENPWYASCNNISSLYVAREHLEDVIILDGDQIIYNDSILATEFDRSGYNAVYTDGATDEWLMTVDKGIVTGCSRTGGTGGWQLYSISRWTKHDGRKLKRQLEHEFEEEKNRQIYWDDLPMFCYPGEYTLGIREMQKNDIIEIDNFSELTEIDPSYLDYEIGG